MTLPLSFRTMWIFGLGGLLALSPVAKAADPVPDSQVLASQLSQVADSLSQYFMDLKSCEFRVTQETVGLQDGERFPGTLFYTGSEEFYKYYYAGGSPKFTSESAFNGEYAETLDKDSGMLHIQKGKKFADDDAENVMGALQPFAFFNADQYEGPRSRKPNYYLPTVGMMSNADDWRKRLSTGTTASVVVRKGKSVICVTMPGGGMISRLFQTTYKVFFDPSQGYFPIAWERAGVMGEERDVYEVEEFGTVIGRGGKSFLYPKRASRYIYYDVLPYCKKAIEITDFKVGKDYDLYSFTIDESLVKAIHDLDKQTYIRVEK